MLMVVVPTVRWACKSTSGLVVEPYPSEKYESIGMMIIPNMMGKNDPFMFQSTNQL